MRSTKQAETSSTLPTTSEYPTHLHRAAWLTFRYSQDQSSEEFIGEWAEQRGIRDQLVIATKVSNLIGPVGPVLIQVQSTQQVLCVQRLGSSKRSSILETISSRCILA